AVGNLWEECRRGIELLKICDGQCCLEVLRTFVDQAAKSDLRDRNILSVRERAHCGPGKSRRRLSQEPGNLSMRREREASGRRIRPRAACKEEGNFGRRVVRIGNREAGIQASPDFDKNSAFQCWNRSRNSRFRNQDSILTIAEYRHTRRGCP